MQTVTTVHTDHDFHITEMDFDRTHQVSDNMGERLARLMDSQPLKLAGTCHWFARFAAQTPVEMTAPFHLCLEDTGRWEFAYHAEDEDWIIERLVDLIAQENLLLDAIRAAMPVAA